MSKVLLNLNTADYEHPFDRRALAAVKKVPVLPELVESILTWSVVKKNVVSLCGTNYHITHAACPELFSLFHDVFKTLDLSCRPEIYCDQSYYINAYTTGYKESSYIVVSDGAVDRLDDDELKFVIGHEAGHIKSGHVLYHLLTAYVGCVSAMIPGIGAAALIGLPVALKLWNRMSEFTADRAGLLACQDLDACLRAIMKMAGLPSRYYGKASVEGFIQQAKEFEHRYSSTSDKIYRMIEIIDEDHPWTVLRAAELVKWVESGEYAKILNKTSGSAKKCPVCKQDVASDANECPFCGYKF